MTHQACLRCGKTLQGIQQKKFCSPICGLLHKKPERSVKVCAKCGAEFSVALWESGRKYCAQACAFASRKQPRPVATCKFCGVQFEVNIARGCRGDYCSRVCAGKAAGRPDLRVAVQCKGCGASFERFKTWGNKAYCSHPCYARTLVGKDMGGTVEINCATCSRSFQRRRFYATRRDGKPPQQFCSRACATPRIAGANTKHSPVDCAYCGKRFQPRSNLGKLNEFCSRKCAGASGRSCQALIAKQERGEPTSIEQKMADAFNAQGVAGYIFQYPVLSSSGLKRYVCDFAFPAHKLIVECDGNYWHSLPKSIASDKRKNGYLKKKGYKVLRFTETQINQDVAACVHVVRLALETQV